MEVDDSNNKNKIGSSVRKEPIRFEAGQETTFKMPFFVVFSPNQEYGVLNDPSLNEIIQLCLGGAEKRTTTIRYEAKTDIAALRWSPIKPSVGGELKINCPFQGEALRKFISAISGSAGNGVTGTAPGTTSLSRTKQGVLGASRT
jgi:hypothetical protein